MDARIEKYTAQLGPNRPYRRLILTALFRKRSTISVQWNKHRIFAESGIELMALGDSPPDERLRPYADMIPGGSPIIISADGASSLRGAYCAACGTAAFPMRAVCMACGSTDVAAAALPRGGRLYSLTTIHASSSRPVPYTIGYIDLDNGVRLLASVDPATLIDERVSLATEGDHFHFVPHREN